ncbi:MAG: uroporphyrinogen-III synthase [Pseudomonadota bacterium]
MLVTRTEPGAQQTAARLTAERFTPVVSPVLRIEPLDHAQIDFTGAAGLIFTSANGVRAYTAAYTRRDLSAWCVGPASSDCAARAGFADVRNANGDAEALINLIAREAGSERGPGQGRLIHVANAAAAGEVVRKLQSLGLNAGFAALYETREARVLTASADRALAAGTLGAVLIHSAKAAGALARLIAPGAAPQLALAAISAPAAAPLAGRAWARQHIAAAPNEDALINALRMCYTRN